MIRKSILKNKIKFILNIISILKKFNLNLKKVLRIKHLMNLENNSKNNLMKLIILLKKLKIGQINK